MKSKKIKISDKDSKERFLKTVDQIVENLKNQKPSPAVFSLKKKS